MRSIVRSAAAYALICALLLAAMPVCVRAEMPQAVDYAASVPLDLSSDTVKAEVTVKTFIDGDTTHFFLSGPSTLDTGVISGRYLAVNTPESTGKIEEYGKAASAFTKARLENAEAILIESDDGQWNRDSNGTRYLVWVWYKPQGAADYRNLNIELLQSGLAKANSSGQNRYGDTCIAAIAQAKAMKLGIYSGEKDPDFFYGAAIEVTMRELRLHPEEYDGKKVACTGVITLNSNNSVYVEAYDPETGLYFGLPVYYGYNLSGGGMEVLHVGNEARIVGTLQYYEAGGEYQISGITYRMMKPDDPGNIRKLSEGHAPACVATDLQELLHGEVVIDTDEGAAAYDRSALALATSVTLSGLTVESVDASEDATILHCAQGEEAVTVRIAAALDTDSLTGKKVDVRGVVTTYAGQLLIKAFTQDGIAVLP